MTQRAAEAKGLELQGRECPRHLAGRSFAVVVHGDVVGAEILRRALSDWLSDMHLIEAAAAAYLDRLVGYYEPYATSHAALDADHALQLEIRNAAPLLAAHIRR